MYIKPLCLETEPRIQFKTLQSGCFYIIALNLLWAYFASSALSAFFSLACIGMFAMMWVNILINRYVKFKLNTMLCYVGFIFWSLLMILVFDYIYPVHSVINFLIFNTDAYAIFFIRLFVSVLPCMVFVDLSEFTIDKTVKVVIFIVLLVTVVLTSRAVALNPNALRERSMMELEGLEDMLIGTPAYAITYAYAILFPAFFHKVFVTQGKNKIYYIICTAMLSYILIVAQYATALLIATLSVVVYLMVISNSKNRVYIFLIALIFGAILVATNGGSDIFHALAQNVEGVWAVKLEDIALTLSGKEDSGSVSSRASLYQESWDSFMQSPLLGKLWKKTGFIGGHATAIDVLGLTGIFGFGFMMMSICGNYLRMKNHESYQSAKPAVITVVLEFVVLVFFKNIITSMAIFFAFFVMVPLLLKAEEEANDESC